MNMKEVIVNIFVILVFDDIFCVLFGFEMILFDCDVYEIFSCFFWWMYC